MMSILMEGVYYYFYLWVLGDMVLVVCRFGGYVAVAIMYKILMIPNF
jgi:hypothetical protein